VNLNDPVATALRTADALGRAGHRYALFGGLLLAAYGEPRETRDVDIAVVDLSADAARQALEAAGINGVVSFDGVTFGGLRAQRPRSRPAAQRPLSRRRHLAIGQRAASRSDDSRALGG
jgi:hypothetical protein